MSEAPDTFEGINYTLLGSAVQGGEIQYLSVSQVTKFDPESYGGCERRWWFDKVGHIKEPQSKAQADGNQVHKEIEHYLTTGQDLLGKIARRLKHLLPEPMTPGLRAEEQIATQNGRRLQSPLNAAGIPFVGKIDLALEPSIEDHKTTSKKQAELPTGAEIAASVQMTGYGIVALAWWSNLKFVRLAHNYAGKKERFGETRAAVVDADVIRTRWARVEALVDGPMKRAARESDPMRVPGNEASCHAYNRPCFYIGKCFPDPIDALVQLTRRDVPLQPENDSMNLMDKLMSGATPIPTLSAPLVALPLKSPEPSPVSAPVALAVTPPPERKLPQPAGRYADGSAFYSPQQQDLLGIDQDGNPLKQLVIEDRTSPQIMVPVLAPDAPKSNPALAARPPPAGEVLTGIVAERAAALQAMQPPPVMPEVDRKLALDLARAQFAEGGAPKKRKTKSATIETVSNVAQSNPETPAQALAGQSPAPGALAVGDNTTPGVKEAPAPKIPDAATSVAGGPRAPHPIFPPIVIAVDCVVHGGASFAGYVEGIAGEIAASQNVPDLRFPAGKDNPLSFGGWRGVLAAMTRKKPPPPGFYCTASGEISDVVCEALESTGFALVIRGRR